MPSLGRHADSPGSTNLLEAGLEKLALPGFGGADKTRKIALLKNYIEEIELFNKAYGLVKVENQRELVIKHILDSLAPLAIIADRIAAGKSAAAVVDVGSGAGLPGIPLAIALPHAEFTLVERMGRRAGFLRNCAAVLDLPNVHVEETEMEKAEPARFDIAVFRAFRPLEPAILNGLLRLLKKDGFLAAWKGRYAAATLEMANAEKAVPGLTWEITPTAVPFLDEERHLVVINPHTRKTSNPKHPRIGSNPR